MLQQCIIHTKVFFVTQFISRLKIDLDELFFCSLYALMLLHNDSNLLKFD